MPEGAPPDRLASEIIRRVINLMVNDVVDEARRRIALCGRRA